MAGKKKFFPGKSGKKPGRGGKKTIFFPGTNVVGTVVRTWVAKALEMHSPIF
jgi:hypothetical protein